MTDYSEVDFFTDPGVTEDPYPYYEYLRAQGPVCPVNTSGMVAVTPPGPFIWTTGPFG